MTQKAFSKHSEYRTYSTKGTFEDKEFDSTRRELLPSKYGSIMPSSNGTPAKEFYYEYSEEKNPTGTYDRKDLHTVEQYEFTHPQGELPHFHSNNLSIASPPQKSTTTVVTTTTNRDLSHNIEELDSLLDDLQRDQERKLYKGGYTSDTMESSSFDYRSTMPKSYNTVNTIEKNAEWVANPIAPTQGWAKEVTRNQVTESHLVPDSSHSTVVCPKCREQDNLKGSPMNKVTTTVKTYTYEVPADQDPSTVPIPGVTPSPTTSTTNVSEKYVTTNNRSYIQENHDHRTYANTHFETSTPVKQLPPPPPSPHTGTGCQYCSHCNSRITTTNTTTVAGSPPSSNYPPPLPPHGSDTTRVTTRTTHYTTLGTKDQGPPYPQNNSPTYSLPIDSAPKQDGPTVYKYHTTTTTYNTVDNRGKPGPFPAGQLSPPLSPSPFPRTESPAPRIQEPPKRLDELLADFPDANARISDEGIRHRPNPARGPGGSINGNLLTKENSKLQESIKKNEVAVVTPSKNVEGPAVYYPPGHEMFARKDEAAYQQAGGGYMKAKGKYKYEAESSSKSKSSSSVTAVPVCLPLCCAMPCTII